LSRDSVPLNADKFKLVAPVFSSTSHVTFNPILHMWFRDSCLTCDGLSTLRVFSLLFKLSIVI
jgi:hypothetical protein